MKKEVKMTEAQFIEKFKSKGFSLYKTKEVTKKLRLLYKAKDLLSVDI